MSGNMARQARSELAPIAPWKAIFRIFLKKALFSAVDTIRTTILLAGHDFKGICLVCRLVDSTGNRVNILSGSAMDNMEFNKLFAALLVAGIVASLSGFVAHRLVEPHEMGGKAYPIEGVAADAGAGAAKAAAKPEPVLALLASADAA